MCSPVLVPVEEVHAAALHGAVGSPSWCGAGAGSWWAPNSCGDATRSMEQEENAFGKRLKNMNRKKRRRTFCGDCCNLSWN